MASSLTGNSVSQTAEVLIVGAGPVGLYVALRLGQAGISVKVFEKESAISTESRALGYYGGSLIALDRARVLEKAIAMGFTSFGVCWRKQTADKAANVRRLGDIIAKLQIPKSQDESPIGQTSTLLLQQCKLAQLLHDEALATGFVSISFEAELTALQDVGDSVVATFTNPSNGAIRQHQAPYLIGADGGRSSTRKLIGIPFKGHSWAERLVAINVKFATPAGEDMSCPTAFIVHPIHFGLISPLEPFEVGKKTLYRVVIAVHPEDTRSDEDISSMENAINICESTIPGPRPLEYEIVQVTPYRTHQLCASTFRRGRCVLAGDAAHLNNPFGAMGLTSGLLDGEALADTLELVINENHDPELLSVYSSERSRIFQTFIDPTTTWNKLRCAADPETASEDWALQMLIKRPHEMKNYGIHFFSSWRTDMRSLIAKEAAESL
ncbi:FAD binding domain-containing protein [Colletotrichum tofieldiae]|uniref:FAD binding domain-containing protein n=1 Tax=Colletotrichum tofieldiae TaxID=708197 RepID=A0A161W5L2_9PEZI|nr:FAD binding domain-containing protein [Colletotrichum tofieldiae]